MPTLVWLRAAAVAALAAHATAQQCYYPNGNKAPDTEKPCSTAEGSACCPDSWECLDNGLCHYPANNLYGRYSCTDKTWKSEGCASNMCTYGMTVGGGESIKQCADHDDQWCCNADDTNVKCCQESPSPRPFFALQNGNAYATIGSNQASTNPNIATITGLATSGGSSGGGNSASQTSAQRSSAAPSTTDDSNSGTATPDSVTTTPTPTPFSSVATSLSTGSAGVVTIENTVLVTPTATAGSSNENANGDSDSGSSSNLGLIIGCAVGIPLALALLGIIFWLLRKRRQQAANPYKEASEIEGDSPLVGGAAAAKLGKKETYRNSRPATAEIDGNPIGAGQPNRVSELPSGNGFEPGQGAPYGPDAVGIGGGNGNRNTWDSQPPQYSPAQAAFNHPDAAELPDNSVHPVLNEKGQPYQPYRPPQPVAELPSVTTPPEDLEKQMPKR
ncbi:hypothetical protein AG0111_0g12289 [Alternaria gaisen]|uniref:Uncharacterized protein n=1 Tax=Alternaria gaisen TaxID=167740 RepID=A0ACB6F4S8_9PLEO|nr:hypothetical protein AG0111_0g12289 [Alternaria gaisen]